MTLLQNRVRLFPVVERTSVGDPPPWPTLPNSASHRVQLSEKSTGAEIGSVLWQLAQYNQVAVDNRAILEILRDVVTKRTLILPGGIAVEDDSGRVIYPGCCAGLEGWREWLSFEVTGATPWMGHEPDPWLERIDDVVRVWSHGALAEEDYGAPYVMVLSTEELRCALVRVGEAMDGFLLALRTWGIQHAPEAADALTARFDAAFVACTDQ